MIVNACSLVAAGLEGIRLEVAIMQKDIKSSTHTANTKLEEKIKRVEQDLGKKKGKTRQLEAGLSELNNIIASLENKLTVNEALDQSLRLEVT